MALLPPPPITDKPGSFAWLDWYTKLRAYLVQSGSLPWSLILFSGSSLSDIQTRSHGQLQAATGFAPGSQSYHLSETQYNAVNSGISGTVPLAKITALGTDGSLTFTNGILTAKTDPT